MNKTVAQREGVDITLFLSARIDSYQRDADTMAKTLDKMRWDAPQRIPMQLSLIENNIRSAECKRIRKYYTHRAFSGK